MFFRTGESRCCFSTKAVGTRTWHSRMEWAAIKGQGKEAPYVCHLQLWCLKLPSGMKHDGSLMARKRFTDALTFTLFPMQPWGGRGWAVGAVDPRSPSDVWSPSLWWAVHSPQCVIEHCVFCPCTFVLSAFLREAIYQSYFYKLKSVFLLLNSSNQSHLLPITIQTTIYTFKGLAVLVRSDTCKSSG